MSNLVTLAASRAETNDEPSGVSSAAAAVRDFRFDAHEFKLSPLMMMMMMVILSPSPSSSLLSPLD